MAAKYPKSISPHCTIKGRSGWAYSRGQLHLLHSAFVLELYPFVILWPWEHVVCVLHDNSRWLEASWYSRPVHSTHVPFLVTSASSLVPDPHTDQNSHDVDQWLLDDWYLAAGHASQ